MLDVFVSGAYKEVVGMVRKILSKLSNSFINVSLVVPRGGVTSHDRVCDPLYSLGMHAKWPCSPRIVSIASSALELDTSAVMMNEVDDEGDGEGSPESISTGGLGCATEVGLKYMSETRELV